MPTMIGCVHRAHRHAENRRVDILTWRRTVGIMLAFGLPSWSHGLLWHNSQ